MAAPAEGFGSLPSGRRGMRLVPMSGPEEAGDQSTEPAPPGVSMRVGATDQNLALVAAVATGAAEALDLDLEPSISLRTIAVEAAGNVITHAYPSDGPGPLEVEISGERDRNGGSQNGGPRPVQVSIRDEGVGCGLPPSASDPPGLGLSIICSLSDAMTLRSDLDRGTSLDATIIPGHDRDASNGRHPPAPERCELSFGDGSFLRPILARVLAAQVDTGGISVDELGEAVRTGDAIADSITSVVPEGPLPPMTLTQRSSPPGVSIGVGPIDDHALMGGLRDALAKRAPELTMSREEQEGGETAHLTLPLGKG